ncbi:SGNH/GDSL hydrolase family protein [Proteiniphilum sp.]|uniref:SGNH/GDSL hydrolase family protein n=1 Tax=Proteiniphilum sp. TaxID=1926877 RepID=UPI002B1F0D2B|nr:SGNH/GDSL hydrolase family protein [Proteiniphilum sp.]MEA4916104.1 SGNH/GDSL hydrolase family protein [Proteiniphilum sp.]
MKTTKLLFLFIIAGMYIFQIHAESIPTTLLYHKILNETGSFPELVADAGITADYTPDGLKITGKEGTIRLDRYYSLGERMIRYHVKFSDDAVALFKSNTGDFQVSVDIARKRVSVATNPESWKKMDFLDATHEYLVEIYRSYQKHMIRIVDVYTAESDILSLTMDGPGGWGVGIENSSFDTGRQHDYYCFGLQSGTSLLVRQISVLAGACDLFLLIYGDSITEPDGYFPTRDFPSAWTQLIMKNVPGRAMSSGRGGCTIHHVLERIKNELPYVKAKYVMVTIGTNGGNTEENLSELVEYILSQGSVPILNNIPCNESGTQIGANQMIEKIRRKYNINGCKFDVATSINQDGLEVDKSTMYHEDYTGTWGQIYHHPNVKGSQAMYIRTLIDVPEVYDATLPD